MLSQKRKKLWGNNPKFKVPKISDVRSSSANRFHLLANEEEEEHDTHKEKIPPIVVDSVHSFSSVFGLIGDRYMFKRMSIGTKIISSSRILYNEALNVLRTKKYQFYTHEIKDAKTFKLVLFGLIQMDTKIICDEFNNSHNINPVSVKEITTKRSTADDTLYLIEFDRQQVSKRDILKIRYFSNIAVYWRRPLKGSKGPTQCTKCSMYGHGARNCNRVVVCAACAGNHEFADCQLNKAANSENIIYKCYNCARRNFKNVKHRADDPKCPCRQEYLEIRQRTTSRNKVPQRTNMLNFNSDEVNFPQLPGKEHQNYTRDSGAKSNVLYSDVTRSKTLVNRNEDDISNEKLMQIFFDAVDALQRCQNKYDKLRVLGMMLQHAI